MADENRHRQDMQNGAFASRQRRSKFKQLTAAAEKQYDEDGDTDADAA
jgi:hypothetical protein